MLEIGRLLQLPVQPADPEHTFAVSAGSLTFGVESRMIQPDAEFIHRTLPTLFADAAPEMIIPEAVDLSEFEDDDFVATGPSIHVYDSDNGKEYLRFDLFDREPHYHYLMPDRPDGYVNRLCMIDTNIVTDLPAFAMTALRNRLTEMLTFAGAGYLSTSIDAATVVVALDQVEDLIQDNPAPVTT